VLLLEQRLAQVLLILIHRLPQVLPVVLVLLVLIHHQ
jgi:hypothetical protein